MALAHADLAYVRGKWVEVAPRRMLQAPACDQSALTYDKLRGSRGIQWP
ncbi:hypothetical protein OG840_21090 [Streptomyces sp. NBC_01764]|nr:hypothetical protein [Streptomyces sp. NBC_01764]MCX4404146.1 hypothetical protein [Streptomyces sp. NBC_01764]